MVTSMKILFLHGWQSTPGGLKPTFLKDHGHEVLNPGRADETVPFADSEELFRNSGLPSSARIVVGTEHRLADPQSLAVMLEACERRLK